MTSRDNLGRTCLAGIAQTIVYFDQWKQLISKMELVKQLVNVKSNKGDKTVLQVRKARIFQEIGGTVDYFGKPYPLVYNQSIDIKNKKVLCIGDNLNTDIKGANIQNFNSMLISDGIHKIEINNNLNNLFKKYDVTVDYIQSSLKW